MDKTLAEELLEVLQEHRKNNLPTPVPPATVWEEAPEVSQGEESSETA